MKYAWQIAWREIRWEIFGDRGAIFRMAIFAALPVAFVLTNRSPRIGEIGVSTNVLLFTFAISLLIAVVLGFVPVIHASRQRFQNDLQDARRQGFRGVAMVHGYGRLGHDRPAVQVVAHLPHKETL